MKQYVITDLSTGEKYRLDTVDTNIRESLNSLKIPRIEPANEDKDYWDEILIDIMSKGYSITVEEKIIPMLDFSLPLNGSKKGIEKLLNSDKFNIAYGKNVNDYKPYDIEWSEYVIEDFIEKLTKLGYEIEYKDIQFNIDNCQGRGASFDGKLNVIKFMELNENYFYRELYNAIVSGHVNETNEITKNSFANNYSHEKTRHLDGIEFVTNEASDILEGERLVNIKKGMEAERLELCNYLMKKLEAEYERQFSKERLLEIFVDNQYKFDKEGNIL